MKKILTFVLCLLPFIVWAQTTVPVTFHFKPDITTFQKLRLVGTFNGWNNADDNLLMTDTDGDGEYQVTTNLAPNEHMYKFVMDADWGFAYTDPENPRINAADANNSMLTVKDPMITYLTPRDINSKGERYIDNSANGLPIRAVFAFNNTLSPSAITLTIDGVTVANAGQYYNVQKKELIYQPNPALSTGEHTVTISITTTAGSDEKTSRFTRDPNYVAYQIPWDFYYDENNTTVQFAQTLTSVAAVGTFNNWNASLNTLQDQDKDGLWEGTALLFPGTHEYKFKLNNISWVNDPDEPKIGSTADANNLIYAVPDSQASIKLLEPSEGKVYTVEPAVFNFKVLLRPGVKSAGINRSSITIKVNNAVSAFTFDTVTSIASLPVSFTGEGRHTIEVEFQNNEGIQASEIFSYGIYTGSTGYFSVDAINDDNYSYPAEMNGTADILSVKIDETPGHDSLRFDISMKDIGDNTRLGFIVSAPSSSLISDPKNLDIKTIDWNGQGFFASIAPADSSIFDNRIMTKSNPPEYSSILIDINSNARTSDVFTFKLSLALLDSLIGSWTQKRNFYVFSYLSNDDVSGNSYETNAIAGSGTPALNPDIYDAAFMRSGSWQERMMHSYIAAGEISGPRFVSLDGDGRGLLSLSASDISDSLATFGPSITFLTPPADYWYSNVIIHGELSDSAITSVVSYFNGRQQTLAVSNARFSLPVTLLEGENIFYVEAEDNRGYKSISKNLILNYVPDNLPKATVSGHVSIRQAALTVDATSSAGSTFNYTWSADPKNPNPVTISPNNTKSVTVDIPAKDGEYYFNIRVRDQKNKIVNSRIMVVASPDSVFIPDINYHASWIDDAIVYEIYPRSFSEQGGFLGIADKVDYLKDLGINTVWFMPIYKGPTTHGYEITDYYDFEEDYGNRTAFMNMVSTLKNNGIKVILDYVVNHTGVSHPFMQNVFEYKGYSPYSDFYIWSGEPGNSAYQYLFDWTSLPNLNHNNPDVRKYFIDAAKYWVSYYGIDGFRCDVAWGVEQRNTLFWQEWRAALKNIKPEVFLEAEAASDQPVFYQKRFDSANDWELRNRILGALNGSVTIASLHQEVMRSYPTHARPFRFMENHDETRITSMFDAGRSLLAHTLLFTLNGVPLIYSGGEVGELTRREEINWSDPDNMKPYFKKLIDIRKKYIHNPVIALVPNNDIANVYSYSSRSGSNIVVTAANFRESAKSVVLNITGLISGNEPTYLTNLITGAVIPVTNKSEVPISLDGYQAGVFYYGTDTVVVTGIEEYTEDKTIPMEYKLFQNYPNPFNPSTKIKYQVKDAGNVSIKIYNVLGAETAVLVNEIKAPGVYEVNFNAGSLPSGVYFCRITAGNYTAVKKLVLLK